MYIRSNVFEVEAPHGPHTGCYLKGEAVNGSARLQGYNDLTVEMTPSVKGTI